jgi:hypothetical protein
MRPRLLLTSRRNAALHLQATLWAARCARSLGLRLGAIGLLLCTALAAHAQEPLAATPASPLMLQEPPREVTPHAIALRARWVTVPGWSIATFLKQHTQLNDGWSVGLSYVYRRSGFDVVVSADYSWLQAQAGNFLGKTNDPATETHFTRFDKLSSLSLDVSLVGHWNLTRWMELRFGGGLGAGYVFGEIYQITNNSGCTEENAGDPSRCYPKNVGPIDTSRGQPSPATVQRLDEARCSPDFTDGGRDTPGSPCTRRTETYPFNVRIVPVLNVQLGLRFQLQRHVYLNIDGGWRLVGFFLGGGPEFRF